MADRPRPVAILEFGPVYNLSRTQWASVRLTMLRYFAWVDSGRIADPWASGAAGATQFDRPQIKHHKPAGGYGPGRAAEPEPDPALTRLDDLLAVYPDEDRALLRWRIADDLTVEQCAERFGVSADTVEQRWRRLGVRLFYRLP